MPDSLFRCLFEAFTAITSNVDVQMCFSPSDEQGLFEALHAGQFDAKAVTSEVDAMRANATIEADKTMIMHRITQEIGLEHYNQRLRRFLEQVGAS